MTEQVPASPEVTAFESVDDLLLEAARLQNEADLRLARKEAAGKVAELEGEVARQEAALEQARARLAAATTKYERPAADLAAVRAQLAGCSGDDSDDDLQGQLSDPDPQVRERAEDALRRLGETMDRLSLDDRLSQDILRAGLEKQERKLLPLVERRQGEVRTRQNEVGFAAESAAHFAAQLDAARKAAASLDDPEQRRHLLVDDLDALSRVAPLAAYQRATRLGLALLAGEAGRRTLHAGYLKEAVLSQLRGTDLYLEILHTGAQMAKPKVPLKLPTQAPDGLAGRDPGEMLGQIAAGAGWPVGIGGPPQVTGGIASYPGFPAGRQVLPGVVQDSD